MLNILSIMFIHNDYSAVLIQTIYHDIQKIITRLYSTPPLTNQTQNKKLQNRSGCFKKANNQSVSKKKIAIVQSYLYLNSRPVTSFMYEQYKTLFIRYLFSAKSNKSVSVAGHVLSLPPIFQFDHCCVPTMCLDRKCKKFHEQGLKLPSDQPICY